MSCRPHDSITAMLRAAKWIPSDYPIDVERHPMRTDLIETLFAPAWCIADFTAPVRGTQDESLAAGYFLPLCPLRWHVERTLGDLTEALLESLPNVARESVEAMRNLFKFEECISLGDVVLALANSELRTWSKRGWLALRDVRTGRKEDGCHSAHAAKDGESLRRSPSAAKVTSAEGIFPSDLARLMEVSRSTLNRKVKQIGVPTPGIGRHDFRYPLDDAVRIVRHIISNNNSKDTALHDRRNKALADLQARIL